MSFTLDGLIDAWQRRSGLALAASIIVLFTVEARLLAHGFADASTNALHVVVGTSLAAVVYSAATTYLAAKIPHQTEWWAKQVAVVTGGEGGLGAAIVHELQHAGCGHIVSVDLRLHESNGHGNGATNGHSSKVLRFQCDVSSSDDVRRVAAKIRADLGVDPTILVSNAGIMSGKPLLDMKDGEFERTLAVNTNATYYWVRELLPAMLKENEGHIVATASIMGYVGINQMCDYVASKHAVVGFMESLRYELDEYYQKLGIYTTLLVLGQLQTPLFVRVRLSKLGHAFMPPAKPSVVARDVIKRLNARATETALSSLHRQRHGYVFRARTARLMPLLAALPLGLRNLVQDVSGANKSLHPASEADEKRRWDE